MTVCGPTDSLPCLMIALSSTSSQPEITSTFGQGIGRVMMANLDCKGTELSLSDCGFVDGKKV